MGNKKDDWNLNSKSIKNIYGTTVYRLEDIKVLKKKLIADFKDLLSITCNKQSYDINLESTIKIINDRLGIEDER